MKALFLHQRAGRTEKGTKFMQVGAQKQPVRLIDCKEWSQSENLGGCQGQLIGQSEVSVWKR